MRSKLSLFILLGLVSHTITAQVVSKRDSSQVHTLRLSSSALISYGGETPFWLHTNNSGRLSKDDGWGALLTIEAFKKPGKKFIDYFYGIEGQFIANSQSRADLIQSFAGVNVGNFSLHLGMKEEVFGLNDSTLSTGNLTYGTNARPIPKLVFQTKGWMKSPVFGKFLSFKAYIAHGWFEQDRFQSGAMLHQKYLYVRGRAFKNKLEIITGLHHNAQWGGKNLTEETAQPNGIRNFAKIFAGLSGGDDALQTDQLNALGNHLGSYDLSASYDFGTFIIRNYWQFIWDDKSGLTPFNWKDGLIGLSLKAKNKKGLITGFNAELIRTSSQDARKNDGEIQIFEPDNFFNNGVYRSGWTYNGSNIGNTMFFILNPGSTSNQKIKNTVNGLNLGIEGVFEDIISYTINYQSIKNHGTLAERIEPGLRLNLLGVGLLYSQGPHSFGLRGTIQWGNYPGKNAGLQFSYSRSLRL